jgi:hypothetical protein
MQKALKRHRASECALSTCNFSSLTFYMLAERTKPMPLFSFFQIKQAVPTEIFLKALQQEESSSSTGVHGASNDSSVLEIRLSYPKSALFLKSHQADRGWDSFSI